MGILEHRSSGTGTLQDGSAFDYDVRFLTPGEVAGTLELHHRVLATLPQPLLLYERSASFFHDCITERGCVVGAFHDERIIAYAALYRPRPSEENYGEDLGLSPDALQSVGHLAGSAVDPLYRGNGLQKRLVELRTGFAREAGVRHLCGEVLPQNVISIANHLARGFLLEVDKIDRVGLVCYVLHRDLEEGVPTGVTPTDVIERSARCPEACCEALRTGRTGFEVVGLGRDPHIRFGRFPAL